MISLRVSAEGLQVLSKAVGLELGRGSQLLLDTRALILSKGIRVTGAGKDLAEARLPAIVECKGLTVGFLGYCSVIPKGGDRAVRRTWDAA